MTDAQFRFPVSSAWLDSPALSEAALVKTIDAQDKAVHEPACESLRRARRAVAERRIEDAVQNLDASVPDSVMDSAWKSCLKGECQLVRHCPDVSRHLAMAVALALTADRLGDGCGTRLAALAYGLLGKLSRSQDRPREAFRFDRLSLELSVSSGIPEERLASLLSCALDAQIAGELPLARGLFERLFDCTARIDGLESTFLARSSSQFARLLLELGDYVGAATAADRAAQYYIQCEPGGLKFFRAQLLAIEARVSSLAEAESVEEDRIQNMKQDLERLSVEFSSFDPSPLYDIDRCNEHIAFADMLLREKVGER